ncbi:MAG: hypothetical protein HY293_13875, partial [Planctomycetes bacterium]|nr:hypothetical protein [Planctomycetota bacterium]
MNDDDLRKLLQNSLAGRHAPADARERIVSSLRPRRRFRIWSAAALAATAAALLAAAVLALL